ncbi:MAG: hypothetical protein WC955_05130 [Elusimicrobiota bacterium]
MVGPEKIVKVGAVQASVFSNQVVRNGQTINAPKVMIQVRYKKNDKEWAGTNSLGLNDIPKAILALEKAFEYLTLKPETVKENVENQDSISFSKV